jgi:chromosome transmission fidelity protein 1
MNSEGVVLFAVINGKLSEGINVTDKFCRWIMAVGMPFADRNDTMLREIMKFFDSLASQGKASLNFTSIYA